MTGDGAPGPSRDAMAGSRSASSTLAVGPSQTRGRGLRRPPPRRYPGKVRAFQEPVCPVCSKPVRSGTLVLFEHGELFHVRCRSRTLELTAMREVDRARIAQERAARFLAEAERRLASLKPPSGLRAGRDTCPVCGHPATVTVWRRSGNWLAIEGCPCNGFFVWAAIYEERLPRVPAADRLELALRIRESRAMGHEAWCATLDGTPEGPLVVRTVRPDRPA